MAESVTPMWPIVLLILGLAVIAAAVVDANLDRLAIKKRRVNGARQIVAYQALRRNVVKLLVSVLLVCFVVWSETAARAALAYATPAERAVAVKLLVILHARNVGVAAGVLILAASSLWDLYDQHRLRLKVRDGQWEPPPGR